MALLHIEGFEACGSSSATLVTYLNRRYTTSLSQYGIETGPYSDKALRLAAGNYIDMPISEVPVTIIIGFALKITC
jgi:hypothetical protein